MFNDERINIQCGKIYRNGIFILLCVTVLYTMGKIVTLQSQGTECFEGILGFVSCFFCELAVIISCITIFLYALLKFGTEKDERYYFLRNKYYLNSAKILLIIGLSAYVLPMPFLRDSEYIKFTQNYISLVIVCETLAYVYIYYNFRKNGININYSFIFESKKDYYRKVWKNILKFSAIMLIPYAFAAYFELLFNQSLGYMLSILLSYAISVLGLALEYLFVSFAEKRYYDDETSHVIKNGVVASFAVLVAFMILLNISQFISYAIAYNIFNISSPYVSFGSLLAMSSYLKTNLDCIFVTIMLSIVFFDILPQINSSRIWLSGKLMSYALFAKVIWTYTIKPIYTVILQNLLNSETKYYFAVNFAEIFNTFIAGIYIAVLSVSMYLFARELIHKRNISKALYAIPMLLVLYFIVYAVVSVMQLSFFALIVFNCVLTVSTVICFFFIKKTDRKIDIK